MAENQEDIKIQELLDEYERKKVFNRQSSAIGIDNRYSRLPLAYVCTGHCCNLGNPIKELARYVWVCNDTIAVPRLQQSEKISVVDIIMVLASLAVSIYVLMQDHVSF